MTYWQTPSGQSSPVPPHVLEAMAVRYHWHRQESVSLATPRLNYTPLHGKPAPVVRPCKRVFETLGVE